MKIKLIQLTENPIDIMYVSARNCYSPKEACELWEDVIAPFESEADRVDKLIKKENLILKVLKSGHLSIAEHCYLTFTIDGISRAASHQLVRHRLATHSQKSQRYVEIKEDRNELALEYYGGNSEYVKSILNKYFVINGEINNTQASTYISCLLSYLDATNAGLPAEDARAFLPNATKTSIVMSLNLRSFIHLCNSRLCKRAQTEIREMTKLMVEEVLNNNRYNILKPFLVSNCANCTEHESCKNKG